MGSSNFLRRDVANDDHRHDIECAELKDGRAMQEAVISEISWTIAIFLGTAATVSVLVGANF
jgi:hypothetical protein